MDMVLPPPPALLARLEAFLDRLPEAAAAFDERPGFPVEALAALREAGALAAPLPRAFGGEGLGTEPSGAALAFAVLHAFGRAWMPLGRVFEGHVNALRLVLRYGTPAQAASAARDAEAGHLFAIWAAEERMAPVRLTAGRLQGRKTFASGIGAVSRAVVTARSDSAGTEGDAAEVMVLADVAGRPGAARPDLHGMRGAGTAPIDLSGLPAPPGSAIGSAGDYMRQPEISLGAWRTLAVLTGGLQSLVDALRATLQATRRAADPHQRARLGACLVAQETARLWVNRSAGLAEAAEAGEDAAAYVQLARVAVDHACATVMRLVQRSAGLAAQVRPHPIERLCRDLATYTRQPALDEVLGEAAARFARHPLP